MIARLFVILPFSFTIPEGEQFNIYSYTANGYEVRIYPPKKSNIPFNDDVDEITLDGAKAFRANALHIDFVKDTFDRRDNIKCDPPLEFINNIVNLFLLNFRFVTKGYAIKPIDFPNINWKLTYLNDDGSELSSEKGLVRVRGTRAFNFSWIVVNRKVWDDLYSLPIDYKPPIWELLLLDAQEVWPEIGPAIVLAMTALEVFISIILNSLAERSTIPPDLWIWVNKRDFRFKEPATDDQFDIILKILTGISLKEERELWDGFKNLKKARNSFVHEGIAKIGGRALKRADAQRLVGFAYRIIGFIKERLPEDMKWPEFKYKFEVQAKMKLSEK